MIKIEKTEVFGWEAAIRGMRNPMNSWDMSDSKCCDQVCLDCPENDDGYCQSEHKHDFVIGENDLKLMKSLSKAGSDHGKFLRMINVTVDITAPLYWWKEFDTYKVGTVANSCSTMHKLTEKEFTIEDFSCEHLIGNRALCWEEKMMAGPTCNDSPQDIMNIVVDALNTYREKYLVALKTEEECGIPAKDIWWQMIQLLPSSYNQKRTVQLNYQVLKNMYLARKHHKLDEWREFCKWCESLPYFMEVCVNE